MSIFRRKKLDLPPLELPELPSRDEAEAVLRAAQAKQAEVSRIRARYQSAPDVLVGDIIAAITAKGARASL